ncbi:Wzz/FepE/Etk N-terminal domain-containing protein [Siphonobacter aquaeclarae]|uniref:G-rich domain on putative tyrosine kinase n=1 Tax=Siphonobacter aquaeclarae TaxID=563176 RepID=A0A1G9NDH1_9BACT|nr:Wzz/FepE/Etk N-terminal domain-containing protein [Siphonobacter aquaeclarae]SDL84177.1 G-rich domain on putative tyrosine kinase [Siphonobacter aquaeclarae]
METTQNPSSVFFRISDITGFLGRNKWKIAVAAVLCAGLSAVYSLMVLEEYNSSVKLLPEMQSKSTIGGFKALADLAGINLDNAQVSEAIRPDLYPSVLESSPFLLKLADYKVTTKNGKAMTVQQLLESQHSPIDGVKSAIFGWMSSESEEEKKPVVITSPLPGGVVMLSRERKRIVESLSTRISANLDKKTGIISIGVAMPDPVAAAMIAGFSAEYLTDYMLNYRSGKQAKQVEFLKAQMDQAKGRLDEADRRFRSYRDRNRNPFLSASTSSETDLEASRLTAQTLFTELSRQYEQANLKMREETPIIKVLDPAEVPLKRSSPKRTRMVIYGFIFGVMAGAVLSFISEVKWN